MKEKKSKLSQAELKKRLIRAAENGEHAKVAKFLKWGAKPNGMNEYGWNAIYCACDKIRYGMHPQKIPDWLETIRVLFAGGADVNGRYPKYGNWTILIRASMNGLFPAVQQLVASGADVSAVDNLGASALHWAATNGCGDVVQLLIQSGADVNQKTSDGDTPVKWAEDGKKDNESIETRIPPFDRTIEIIRAAGGIG